MNECAFKVTYNCSWRKGSFTHFDTNMMDLVFSNSEQSFFFFYLFFIHNAIEVSEVHYIWYLSIKLQRSGLMDSSTCRYDVNCVFSLWDIIMHTMKGNIVELTAWMVWELFVMHALKYRNSIICLKILLGLLQQL